jgi:hypothetical protein
VVARTHGVIAALQGVVEADGKHLVRAGLGRRLAWAVFAEAGLSAAAFLSMAAGEAFAAWTRMPPHDGLEWPIVRAGERRWTLAEAAGLCGGGDRCPAGRRVVAAGAVVGRTGSPGGGRRECR